MTPENIEIKTIPVAEATQRLRDLGVHITCHTLREWLKTGKVPFGFCVDGDKSPISFIFEKLFDEWIMERATPKGGETE